MTTRWGEGNQSRTSREPFRPFSVSDGSRINHQVGFLRPDIASRYLKQVRDENARFFWFLISDWEWPCDLQYVTLGFLLLRIKRVSERGRTNRNGRRVRSCIPYRVSEMCWWKKKKKEDCLKRRHMLQDNLSHLIHVIRREEKISKKNLSDFYFYIEQSNLHWWGQWVLQYERKCTVSLPRAPFPLLIHTRTLYPAASACQWVVNSCDVLEITLRMR